MRAPGAHRDPNDGSTRAATVVLAVIWSLAGVVGLWPVVVSAQGPAPVFGVATLAHVSGMLAGYGVLVLLALMSRARVLDRAVGSDVLARWHAVGGRLVVSAVVVHAVAAVAGWAGARHRGVGAALGDVLMLPWLMSATAATVLLLIVAGISIRAARRRLSFETWHLVHLWTYVAVALSFLHQLAGPDLTGHRALQILWALLYTHVFGLVLLGRVLTPLRQAQRHRLRVVEVIDEAPGVVSIEVGGAHLDELRAQPGQFFRWRFLTPDTWRTAHPFSLSAPPSDDRLRLTVKALGDGTGHLQRIPVGTWVVAEGPYGAMTAARRTRRDVLLVAGGVGITPMRSLFETLPLGPRQHLLLLYRARDQRSLLFREELERIAYRRGAYLHYLLDDDPWYLSAEGLTRLVPNLARRDVYLCGPPGMTDTVRAALREAGLPSTQLHEERFVF